MKRLLLLLPLLLLGCVAPAVGPQPAPTGLPSAVKPDVAKIAPFVTSLAQTAVPLILNKNPQYAGAIQSVALAIPVAFAAGDLDADSISSAVAVLGAKAGLDSETEAVIEAVLLNGATWYQATYGAQVASATDPNVKTLLTAFATGLSNGVTLWQVNQPKS